MNKAPDSLPSIPRGKASTGEALLLWLSDLERRGELAKRDAKAS